MQRGLSEPAPISQINQYREGRLVTDETWEWEMGIASEEAPSAIAPIILALKVKITRPTEALHAKASCRERWVSSCFPDEISESEGLRRHAVDIQLEIVEGSMSVILCLFSSPKTTMEATGSPISDAMDGALFRA